MNKFFSLTVLIALATTTASAEPTKKIKSPFPSSVFGFKFGATPAENKKACEAHGFDFQSQDNLYICSSALAGKEPIGNVVGITCEDGKVCKYGLLVKNPNDSDMMDIIKNLVSRYGAVHRFDGDFDVAWNKCAAGDKTAAAEGTWFFNNQNEYPTLSFVYRCNGLNGLPSVAVWFTQREPSQNKAEVESSITEAHYQAVYEYFLESCMTSLASKGGSKKRKEAYCSCGANFAKGNIRNYVAKNNIKTEDELTTAVAQGAANATTQQAQYCAKKIEDIQ